MVMALSRICLMSSHAELVDEADLVRVHEARVAHHVAAVGEVDRQHRAAAVEHRRRAVVVQLLVVVRADVAAGERLLEVLEERRVHRHHVLEVAVDGAVLHHQDLAVALEDRRLDLADLLVQQDADVLLAVENVLPRLAGADRAERVGLARPAELRLGLLAGLLQRLVGPAGRERRVLLDLVGGVEHVPEAVGGDGQPLFHVLHRRMHASVLLRRPAVARRAEGVEARHQRAWRGAYDLPMIGAEITFLA